MLSLDNTLVTAGCIFHLAAFVEKAMLLKLCETLVHLLLSVHIPDTFVAMLSTSSVPHQPCTIGSTAAYASATISQHAT